MDDLEFHMCLPYATEVVPEKDADGQTVYLANHPELSGCMSHGRTPEEAIRRLAEVKELYLDTLLEKGIEPPLPSATTTGNRESQMIVWQVCDVEVSEPEQSFVLREEYRQTMFQPV